MPTNDAVLLLAPFKVHVALASADNGLAIIV
jgi:hypothetical protein